MIGLERYQKVWKFPQSDDSGKYWMLGIANMKDKQQSPRVQGFFFSPMHFHFQFLNAIRVLYFRFANTEGWKFPVLPFQLLIYKEQLPFWTELCLIEEKVNISSLLLLLQIFIASLYTTILFFMKLLSLQTVRTEHYKF